MNAGRRFRRASIGFWHALASVLVRGFSMRLYAGVAAMLLSASTHAQLLNFDQILARPNPPQPTERVSYGEAPEQIAELWLPSGRGPHPTIVLIHGGCWQSELPGPELLAWQAGALKQRGFAVWSVSYRRLGHDGAGYPGTFNDIADGVDHLRKLAKKHRLDLEPLVASGHSAGGHLAAWAAARPKLPQDSPLWRERPLKIDAVVSVAGLVDLAYARAFVGPACGNDTIDQLVDLPKRGDAAWADTSPARLLPLGVEVQMLSGVFDVIAPPAHAYRYATLAKAAGDPSREQHFDDAGHFELIAPWTPAGAAVIDAIVAAATAD
jgi:acetyl esterase/lipase